MIYVWSEGEYSNFHVVSLFEGPDGLDMEDVKRRFFTECPPKWETTPRGGVFTFKEDQFRKWAEQTYGLRSLDYQGLDVGSSYLYGSEATDYGLAPPATPELDARSAKMLELEKAQKRLRKK